MDILALYSDFNVEHVLGGQHRHVRAGWVGVACPFCSGHPGYHLGYCYDQKSPFYGKFVCWRCGGKRLRPALAAILGIPEERVRELVSRYGGGVEVKTPRLRPKIDRLRTLRLPPYTLPLSEVPGAVKYLKGRSFDVRELEGVWGVKATGPGSALTLPDGKRIDLSYRVIIPIHLDGKAVSWQARDWTGKSKLRYITCPKEAETVFHKDTLYGLDQAQGMDSVVLMEGVTDVWRWGQGAVATFGTKFRPKQYMTLGRRFKKVTMMFDPEGPAKAQAAKMAQAMGEYGVSLKTVHLRVGCDPADMGRDELKNLVIRRS